MNKETVTGQIDQLTGKIKQSVGETIGNQKLANSGAAEQVKGAAKETWGRVKDTAHEVGEQHRAEAKVKVDGLHQQAANTGHDLRQKATTTAQNVKDTVTHKLDEIKHDHR